MILKRLTRYDTDEPVEMVVVDRVKVVSPARAIVITDAGKAYLQKLREGL